MARSRRVKIFENAVERVARTLSQKWNVRVVWQHNKCETTGSTIYLPTLPDTAPKELFDAVQGHLDHEAAHVVFTDFKCLPSLTPMVMLALNALEDPRIERKWAKMYPGAKGNFRRSQEWTLKKIFEEDSDGYCPWHNLTDLGKFMVASIVYITNEADDTHWFIQRVDSAIMDDVRKHGHFFKDALVAEDTKSVIPLAKKLLAALQIDEDEEVPGGSAAQNGEGEGDGSASGSIIAVKIDGSSSSSASADAADAVSVASNSTETSGDTNSTETSGDTDSAGCENSATVYKPDYTKTPGDADVAVLEMREHLIEETKQAAAATDNYQIYTTEGDVVETMRAKSGDRSAYRSFMQQALRYVAPMKRKMARSLLSRSEASWEVDKTRGKLNPRRIYQVPAGMSKRVFRQRIEAEEYDTAVIMMIDHSQSMSGARLRLAAQTAIVFGELLNQLKIPFAVYGFSTGAGANNGARKSQCPVNDRSIYSRWGDLWLGRYKNWDDSWVSAGPSMVNMERNSKYNTYDGESLKVGAQLLLARPEKRKIMFWLNDGSPYPNHGDNKQEHVRYAKDCAREVHKLVELFAIGINTNAVGDIYKNWVCVNSLETLPKTALSELDALIRKGKSYR